jgi:hypothetical protein
MKIVKIEIWEIIGKMISRTGAIMLILATIQREVDLKVLGGDLTIMAGIVLLLLGSVLEGIKLS